MLYTLRQRFVLTSYPSYFFNERVPCVKLGPRGDLARASPATENTSWIGILKEMTPLRSASTLQQRGKNARERVCGGARGKHKALFTTDSSLQKKLIEEGEAWGSLRCAQKHSARETFDSLRSRNFAFRNHGASCNRGSCRSGASAFETHHKRTQLFADKITWKHVAWDLFVQFEHIITPLGPPR